MADAAVATVAPKLPAAPPAAPEIDMDAPVLEGGERNFKPNEILENFQKELAGDETKEGDETPADADAEKKPVDAEKPPEEKPEDKKPSVLFDDVLTIDGNKVRVVVEDVRQLRQIASLGLQGHARMRQAAAKEKYFAERDAAIAEGLKGKNYGVLMEHFGINKDELLALAEQYVIDAAEDKVRVEDEGARKRRGDLEKRERELLSADYQNMRNEIAGDISGYLEKNKMPADPILAKRALDLQIENLVEGLPYNMEDAIYMASMELKGRMPDAKFDPKAITLDELKKRFSDEEFSAIEGLFKKHLTEKARVKVNSHVAEETEQRPRQTGKRKLSEMIGAAQSAMR